MDGEINTAPALLGNDPYNDLTCLGNNLYLTNYDLGEGSGVRTKLYSFDSTGQALASFDLPLNGQGYISICDDEQYLYLLCQTTGLLLKVTPTGDVAQLNALPYELMDWQTGGIYSLGDSLFTLVWKASQIAVYPLLKENLEIGALRDTLTIPDRAAFRSVGNASDGSSLYLLCSDSAGADYLDRVDANWTFLDETLLTDSLISGVAQAGGNIYASTEDRRVEIISAVVQPTP